MKKVLAPIIVILILAGSAYAALVEGLFPSTGVFPRVPQSDGTLGYILSKILGDTLESASEGDGTVNNTLALNGITSTGYLQHKECEVGTVWKKVEDNGTVTCGFRSAPLVEAGTLTGVTNNLTIFRWGGGVGIPGSNGDTLYYGDLVKTAGSSSGTIIFSDASIIRLDELTTVTLSGGTNSSGNTIAQLILSDGNLWGRVLTSTGINFEAGGYIAGVRGTSISVEKTSTGHTFVIIDSLTNGSDAIGIYPRVVVGPATRESSTTNLGSGSMISLYNDSATPTRYTSNILKSDLLTGNAWRANNTIADIEYLYAILSDIDTLPSGITSEQRVELLAKAENEARVTIPNLSQCQAGGSCVEILKLCESFSGTPEECNAIIQQTDIPDSLIINEEDEPEVRNGKIEAQNELLTRYLICKGNGSEFWPTLGKCKKKDPIIWMVDFTPNKYTNLSFVNQNIRNTILNNINTENAGGSTQLPPLRGKNKKIPAQYEKFYGNTIADDCRNDTSIPDWWTVWSTGKGYKKAPIWTDLNLKNIDSGKFYAKNSGIIFSTNPLYDTLYIKNPENHRCSGEVNGWQTNTFYDGVWLRKNPNIISSYNTSSNGVPIMNTGDYIAYPLSEMGGKDALNGATITIELTDPINSFMGSANAGSKFYVADFGTEKYFLWKGKDCNNQPSTKDYLCKSSNINGIEINSTETQIKIPGPSNATQFVIGNIWLPTSSYHLSGPIGTTIKSITISDTPQ